MHNSFGQKYFLLPLLILFISLFSSCSHFPHGNLQKTETEGWNKEHFVVGSEPQNYHASGEITLWIDNERYRGKVNGHFELFHTDKKWRMDVTGPFNVAVATIILNDKKTAIFAEGKWIYDSWDSITTNLFGSNFPPMLFDILVGSQQTLEGACQQESGKKVCMADGTYFMFENGRFEEFAFEDFSAFFADSRWFVTRGESKTLIFRRKTIKRLENVDATLFQAGNVSDDFDDL